MPTFYRFFLGVVCRIGACGFHCEAQVRMYLLYVPIMGVAGLGNGFE